MLKPQEADRPEDEVTLEVDEPVMATSRSAFAKIRQGNIMGISMKSPLAHEKEAPSEGAMRLGVAASTGCAQRLVPDTARVQSSALSRWALL